MLGLTGIQLYHRCRTDGRSGVGWLQFLCHSHSRFLPLSPCPISPFLLFSATTPSLAHKAWHKSLNKPQPAAAAAVPVVTLQGVNSVGSSAGPPPAGGVTAGPPAWESTPTPVMKVSSLQHIQVSSDKTADWGTRLHSICRLAHKPHGSRFKLGTMTAADQAMPL